MFAQFAGHLACRLAGVPGAPPASQSRDYRRGSGPELGRRHGGDCETRVLRRWKSGMEDPANPEVQDPFMDEVPPNAPKS